jgi:tetratricopeptide (TPR) repeat protein
LLDIQHRAVDLSGLPTSLPNDLIAGWNRTVTGILSHAASTGPDLVQVLQSAPGFALGHAVKGLSCLLLGRSEMFATAREAHAAALAALAQSSATCRELAFVEALGDWLGGRPSAAAGRLQAVLDAEPRDALAMKLVQAIHFVMGRPAAMRASAEALLDVWTDHPARGYLLGCHAFALEETGEYGRAERTGREGVALAPDDAWGLHAVAHVHDMTGRARDGLAWLDGREGTWSHCNNFRFHVWWHRALMHLDLGQYDRALELYDRDIRAEKTDDYRDIANAASLLSRLEVEGVSVGQRWEELADLAEGRATDGCLAFADLHYLLALIGGGRDEAAARLIGRMAATAPAAGEAQRIIFHPGLAAARGLQAFASGDFRSAWSYLEQARGTLPSIGGSHAQRDVFVRITVEAALRGGYLDAAESLLAERQKQRAGSRDGYTERRLALIEAARRSAEETRLTGRR